MARDRARPCHYRHGRATTGTGRAKLLVLWVFGKAWDGTAVPLQARAVPLQARAVPSFWHFGAQIFFSVLLNRSRTITYKIT